MPTYEFHCQKCDKLFELQESIGAYEEHLKRHDVQCPNCHSDRVEQQIAAFEVETSRKS